MNRYITRRFHLNNEEILQILTAGDSGDEIDIAFDEVDQAFLECNLDDATEIIIEGQKVQENIFETDAAIVVKPKKISK